MHPTIPSLLSAVPSWLPGFALGVLTSLGVFKFYIEPRQIAGALQRKYGTALWSACKELSVHLQRIQTDLKDESVFYSLLKIPTRMECLSFKIGAARGWVPAPRPRESG